MALFKPVDNLTKLYVPLWWYGQVDKIDDYSPTHCDLTPGGGAKFGERGYIFDGANDYLIDADGRKVLSDVTLGEWSSIFLTDGSVPKEGSVCGTGTKLYINTGGTAPKITGKIVLYKNRCPNLTYMYCQSNDLTVLDVSDVISLLALSCHSNSISTLDVSALTNLSNLQCYNNSISTLDVSALTGLIYLNCRSNSISTLDVSSLTSLTELYCYGNSISTLDVSSLTSLTLLNCYGNSISTLDVSALTLLTYLSCHNNSMNQAVVDTVLCDMDGHGTSNGTLNISGNAVPGAGGITCKNNLIARGWTVTTD